MGQTYKQLSLVLNKPARTNQRGDGVELGGVQSMSEQLLNMETITSDSLLT